MLSTFFFVFNLGRLRTLSFNIFSLSVNKNLQKPIVFKTFLLLSFSMWCLQFMQLFQVKFLLTLAMTGLQVPGELDQLLALQHLALC